MHTTTISHGEADFKRDKPTVVGFSVVPRQESRG